MSATDTAELRRRFRTLHQTGIFVMPNPWDVGSARLLEVVGFPALATTSSGLGAALGRDDQTVGRDELVRHVAELTAAVGIPVSVDAECAFPREPGGVAETVRMLADAGASGVSIEDFDPVAGEVLALERASEAVGQAVEAAARHGLVVTARAENHLYDRDDLDDTVRRLRAYVAAGADAVYAPGLTDADDIARLVAEAGAPVNVLALPGAPSVPELGRLGVRRVSTGGGLTWTAYGALVDAARTLLDEGRYAFLEHGLDPEVRARAFG
ncbi:isocitrate lyase/phosphoenolpyruvate mutase family protein [Nocardioides sp.]|uniref:isocitrate lyase/PEP mutase family protein n=1 Tax=Nocardioides sp. TaxID=35761 RepID=UPI0035281A82